MKAIKFDDELSDEATVKLLADIDRYPGDEELIIYFNSNGGSSDNAGALADYINRNLADRFTVVVFWECSSAALDFLVKVNAKLDIKDSALSVLHLFSNDLDYRKLQNPRSTSSFLTEGLKKRNEVFLNELRAAGLPEDDITCIAKGEDILIGGPRIRELIAALKALPSRGSL